MNKLNQADRVRIISALVEGNSIRSTSHMIGVSKDTVIKLLVDMGRACARYHDEHVSSPLPHQAILPAIDDIDPTPST